MSIVQAEDPVLRAVAKPVAKSAFGTPALSELLRRMETMLDAEPDGVALAAPQLGVGTRIFIVRYDRMHATHEEPDTVPVYGIFINPEFIRTSKKRAVVDEGCLSVRGKYGKTHRSTRATVRAFDEHGNVFTRGAGGLLAQAFQHEIDHLNGILFIDHAEHLVDIEPPHLTNG